MFYVCMNSCMHMMYISVCVYIDVCMHLMYTSSRTCCLLLKNRGRTFGRKILPAFLSQRMHIVFIDQKFLDFIGIQQPGFSKGGQILSARPGGISMCYVRMYVHDARTCMYLTFVYTLHAHPQLTIRSFCMNSSSIFSKQKIVYAFLKKRTLVKNVSYPSIRKGRLLRSFRWFREVREARLLRFCHC